MANELAVKVKVNLDTNQQALQTEFQKVTAYSQKHPVTLSVKIDKNSLKKSIEDAFGKGATQSMTNAAAKVNDVSKQMNKLIGNMRELNKWEQKLESVQAKTGNRSANIAELNRNIGVCKQNIQDAGKALQQLGIQFDKQDRYIDEQAKLARSFKDVRSAAVDKTNSNNIKAEADAINAVVKAREALTKAIVANNNALKNGKLDDAKVAQNDIQRESANLKDAQKAATQLGVAWKTDKDYLDALQSGQLKITASANELAKARKNAADTEKASDLQKIADTYALRAKYAAEAAKYETQGNTENKNLYNSKAAQAESDAKKLLLDYQNKYNESALKEVSVQDAIAASVEKTTVATNNLNAARSKTDESQRVKDLQDIVKLISEEAAAEAEKTRATQAGQTNTAADAEKRKLEADAEITRLMSEYQKKYNQDAMQTVEVSNALTAGYDKITTAASKASDAQNKSDNTDKAKAEKEAIDKIIVALERKTKAQLDYDNAVKSGDVHAQQDAQNRINAQSLALQKAKDAADNAGIAWQKDTRYLDALHDSQEKTATSAAKLATVQNNNFFKEKEADAKAAAEAINAYAEANKRLIDAQRTGDEPNEAFYTTDAAQKQMAAQKLIDQYEQKYGESVANNVTILNALQAAFEKNVVAQNKFVNSVNDARKANTLAKASMDNYVNSANTSIRKLTENYGKFGVSMTDVMAKYQALETAVTNVTNNGNEAAYLKEVTQCYKELGTAIAAATAEGQRYSNRLNNKKEFDNISAELDSYIKKNPNLSSNGDLWKQIRDLDTAVKNYSGTLEENRATMAHVKAQAEALGLTTETLGQKFTRLWKEHFQTAAVMAGLHLVQQGVQQVYQNVVEVDTAMTELKKVTDETDASYANFTKRAAQQSRELGASISDYIQTTADWARLGYNLPDAEELARVSSLYANVGDGIESASQASEYLISTLKGFDLAASDAERVVDIINQVANTEPVSAQDLSEIMKRSSAALDAANTSFEKTVALGTAMNSVLQDSATTGTALKTLSMYLRATKTELEESGEDATYCASSMSKLRDSILGLTKGQVDIQLDED